MTHAAAQVIAKLNSLKGQLAYVIEVLNAGGLKSWESTEYTRLYIEYKKDIADLEAHITENQQLFS